MRELAAFFFKVHRFVKLDDLFEVLCGQLGVEFTVVLVFDLFEDLVKLRFFDFHHDVREHLDETAIAVEREALVVGQFREANHGLIVQAEVENGVHHARHGGAGAGTDGDKEWIGRIAKLLARFFFGDDKSRFNLLYNLIRDHFLIGVVTRAGFSGDSEAKRHRQTERGHFGQVRTFAAEE
ncbi:hypothetical protein SDC9_108921 [bioreactor metagenome]|uniref:Uncharacterized protein n=1 Tax=bioreactor metagenome TaxID=1076179 RepID=A0A645B9F0_9ZZZZ